MVVEGVFDFEGEVEGLELGLEEDGVTEDRTAVELDDGTEAETIDCTGTLDD
jgi:hypothetical protein